MESHKWHFVWDALVLRVFVGEDSQLLPHQTASEYEWNYLNYKHIHDSNCSSVVEVHSVVTSFIKVHSSSSETPSNNSNTLKNDHFTCQEIPTYNIWHHCKALRFLFKFSMTSRPDQQKNQFSYQHAPKQNFPSDESPSFNKLQIILMLFEMKNYYFIFFITGTQVLKMASLSHWGREPDSLRLSYKK